MCKVEIKNDLFNIVKRIKEIDKNYFVLFDKRKRVYEVHSLNQAFGTYAVTIPYKTLDKRAVDYVLKTRKENINKILQEIELNNKKLEIKEQENLLYNAKYDLTNLLKFYEKH